MKLHCCLAVLLAMSALAEDAVVPRPEKEAVANLPVVVKTRRYTEDNVSILEVTLRTDEKKSETVLIDLADSPEALLLRAGDCISGESKKENGKMWMSSVQIVGDNGLPVPTVAEEEAKRIKSIDASKNPIIITMESGKVYKIDALLHPWYTQLKERQAVCFDYVTRGEERWAHAATIRFFAEGVPDKRLETAVPDIGIVEKVEKEDDNILRVTTVNEYVFWIDTRYYAPARGLGRGHRIPFGVWCNRNRLWNHGDWNVWYFNRFGRHYHHRHPRHDGGHRNHDGGHRHHGGGRHHHGGGGHHHGGGGHHRGGGRHR